MTVLTRSFCVASLLLATCLVLGCGGGGPPQYVVKGRVTNGGEVIPVKPMVGRLRVWFVLQEPSKPYDVKEAAVNPADGTFVVKGADGRGIPPGKYQVCIEWKDDFPLGPDKLDGKFNEANSRILRDIPAAEDIILDVAKLGSSANSPR